MCSYMFMYMDRHKSEHTKQCKKKTALNPGKGTGQPTYEVIFNNSCIIQM